VWGGVLGKIIEGQYHLSADMAEGSETSAALLYVDSIDSVKLVNCLFLLNDLAVRGLPSLIHVA
jgi:hypothetical protein